MVEDSSTRSVPLLYSLISGLQKDRPAPEAEPLAEQTRKEVPQQEPFEEGEPIMFKKT